MLIKLFIRFKNSNIEEFQKAIVILCVRHKIQFLNQFIIVYTSEQEKKMNK